jgi:hypothetical protein
MNQYVIAQHHNTIIKKLNKKLPKISDSFLYFYLCLLTFYFHYSCDNQKL